MAAYYNEFDPYAAQWLRNLIVAGHIAPGDVDERSIVDVHADDLNGYQQCHFFAGIGGWSLGLRAAGWDDTRPVWTGSCPCQPFSTQGFRRGLQDERHLWPIWRNLIAQRRPSDILGEQVASAVEWLAEVRRDLDQMGYAVGAIPIEAASCGGYQLRDRYWFVAGDTQQDDGRAIQAASARQEPEFRGRVLTGTDQQWAGSLDGRIIPDTRVPTLDHAVPFRLAQYRAIGNAIDPIVAAEVIGAYMEVRP